MKKYTKEEIQAMLSGDGFAYNTPIGTFADIHASSYEYDESLDVKEAVRNAYIYGIHWTITHLKD